MNVQPFRLFRWLAFVVVSGAALLALAGRADLPRVWAFLSVFWGVMLLGVLFLDPEIARERLRFGQKTADPMILASLRISVVGEIILGILDVGRFHRFDTVPAVVAIPSFAVAWLAFLFALAAVRVNRFFLPQVRIQTERGHRVVDSGPYSIVRHPGYAAAVVAMPALGLLLGSWLAFALGIATALVFVIRAAREDRFLRGNLEGYEEYATRTRYRLIPGIW